MKKHLLFSFISGILAAKSVFALSETSLADKYFASGNINALAGIYSHSPNNRAVAYLYAKALLNKNNPSAAEAFIQANFNDFLRNDLLHQLLTFYYTNKTYSSYQRIYKQLPDNQRTTNEQCGLDTASGTLTVDTAYLAHNNLPVWCASTLANAYLKGDINKEQRNWMLYNLITYNKNSMFNQIAPSLGYSTINFYAYAGKAANKIPANDFLIVNRITDIGHKYPDQALYELQKSDISGNAKAFLSNYLAMQFAQKHNFKQAIYLYEKYGDNLSDEEYEWLARSYLYKGNWSSLINTIDDMPKSLSQKNVWLYWVATAYASLGKKDKAKEYYGMIPKDYSYYTMLADSALGTPTKYNSNPPKNFILDGSTEGKAARIGLNLYQEGKNNNLKHLITLGMSEWNYAAKTTDDDDLLVAMSNIARQNSSYDLSIYAANQMELRYIELSFPLPFLAVYTQYSKLFGIDPTYTLAVSRQESRFNHKIIAFDGGVGLMQIMPQTALYISRKSGSANCYRKGPECNIKFGSWYLGNLYGKFDNLIYATAAYNAGPGRSRQWQDILGNLDNRIQIELIPISITRDYVQKVISNKAIYDAEIAGTAQINFGAYLNKLGQHHYLNVLDDDHTDAGKLSQ